MTFLRRRRIHVLILVLWCALLMGTTHAIEPAADHSSVQSEGENGKGEEENEGVTAPPVGRSGAPSKIRTCDLRIRSPTLYPAELWAHIICFQTLAFFATLAEWSILYSFCIRAVGGPKNSTPAFRYSGLRCAYRRVNLMSECPRYS